jgi:hypothetical protein
VDRGLFYWPILSGETQLFKKKEKVVVMFVLITIESLVIDNKRQQNILINVRGGRGWVTKLKSPHFK